MDEIEAGRGGYGGDPTDQFHRNEAISAVADDAFIGEEDEDYEDLYNDVNVGENFLESIRKNDDKLGQQSEEVLNNKANLTSPPQPVVQGGGVAVQEDGGRVEVHQNVDFRGASNVNEVGFGRGMGAPGGGGGGFRVELGAPSNKVVDLEERRVSNIVPSNQQMVQQQQPYAANAANIGNIGNVNGTGVNSYGGEGVGGGNGGAVSVVGGGGGGGTILFVGDLHWWTTDAELESELCKYGAVKEVKFFDERASGKSKGYCQVEFYDSIAATACKERMNGHIFNGRPCAVAFASPFSVKRMGEAQVNRNQQQIGQTPLNQPRRGPGDLPAKPGIVGSGVGPSGNHQGGGDNNGRGFGRGNWGRGNSQGGMGGRGPMGPMRNRPPGMGVRGLSGNGNGFGQGISSIPPMMHPQVMMGQGFDPAFGGPMGRMGGYGGFPGGPTTPFPGMLSNFGNVGLPGIAPHVNPAFFGRGMPMNGMGMMPSHGLEGPNMGMWSDPNMGGWGGDEHGGGRVGESSYAEGAASDHQYEEGSQERGPRPNSVKEKDRGSERDWSGSSERRHRDDRGAAYDREKDTGRDHERDRDMERDRERHRDDRDSRHGDHQRNRDRDVEYGDERDRGRSSRTYSKSRISHEEEQRSRSRDADYGKRRRLTPE